MPLTQLIHVTAAYSNAVLVAVLPHINDYAKKLDLPVYLPITQSQVEKCNVGQLQGYVGCGLWLTNGYHFIFQSGIVTTFDVLTNNPWRTDDPATDWPHYIGQQNMTTNEALAFARSELVKLGYDPTMLHCDVTPTSYEGPYDLREGHFPYCQIKWRKEATTIEEKPDSSFITVQINMRDKSLLGLSLISPQIWKPDPKIDVVPETEKDYQERIHSKMFINTNAPKTLGVKPTQ